MNIQLINYQMHSNNQTSFKQVRIRPDFDPTSRIFQNAQSGDKFREPLNESKKALLNCRIDFWNRLQRMKPTIFIGKNDISYIICDKNGKKEVVKKPYGIGNFYMILNEALEKLDPDSYKKHIEIWNKYQK